MKASRLIMVAVALVVVGLVGWIAIRVANVTAVHTYRIEFATLPESDDALREWLASQPDVTQAAVHRDGPTVVVEYVRPFHGGQPLLDPVGEAGRFGYIGVQRYTGSIRSRWKAECVAPNQGACRVACLPNHALQQAAGAKDFLGSRLPVVGCDSGGC